MQLSNFENTFHTVAQAPGGVARLRELILTLAVQGKLVAQDTSDEPASALLKKIRAEKDRLIAEGKIKKDKPLAEITEEEKPFELPVGWGWARLKDLLQKIGAGSTPLGGKEVYVEQGVKFLRSQNVWNTGLVLEGVAFIKPETHEKMSGTHVYANDLLFNITGASIGRCALVSEDFDTANVSQHVTIVRSVNPNIKNYLHLVLISRHVQQTVMDVQVGVSREGLSIAKLGNFLIPVPPLAEQSRIVARVEELMRLCDALEEKGRLEHSQHQQLLQAMLDSLTQTTSAQELACHWQRLAQHFDLLIDRPEAVDALEQTILQLAVRGVLTHSLAGETTTNVLLGDVAELINGDRGSNYPNKDEYVEDGIPFINTGHIDPDGRLSNIRMNRITREKFDSLRSGKVRKNDLVYCLRGATLGKTALVEYEEGAIASSLVIIRSSENIKSEFLYLFLVSPEGRKNIFLYDNGSAQPNLAANSVRKYKIKLPSIAEQSRIVARVTELRALCQQLRGKLTQARHTQTQLAQAWVEQVAA